MQSKKAIEMSFNWIFVIIVGGFILFLAIYMAGKFMKTGGTGIQTQTAFELVSLLNSFETGLASGKSQQLEFKKEAQIYLECDELSNKPFGKQTIKMSEKSFSGKISETGEEVPIRNLYIFSEEEISGNKFYIFPKPFFMPFKVSDLTIIYSKNYCFYKAPDEIKREIQDLNLGNIIFADNLKNCPGTRVCFESSVNCEIKVTGLCNECKDKYDHGKIEKDNREIYYFGNLIYAGIFSSNAVYECNLKRIMNRFKELSLIYIDKEKIIARKGCNANIEASLYGIMNIADALDSSASLELLYRGIENIELINKRIEEGCKLF